MKRILLIFFVLSFFHKVESKKKTLKKIHEVVKDNNDVLKEFDDLDENGTCKKSTEESPRIVRCPTCSVKDRSMGFQWTPVPNMQMCMNGYDPFLMEPLTGKPDPGLREQIFEPTVWDEVLGSIVLSPNVEYGDDINCEIQHQTTVVKSIGDYLKAMSGSSSYFSKRSTTSSMSVPFFSLLADYKKSKTTTTTQSENSEFSKHVRYFSEMEGEAYINRAQCIVKRVRINAFSIPRFTDGFINGLRELHNASKNPDSEESKSILRKFVKSYGINYMSECFMGSTIVSTMRMSKSSSSASEEAQNAECASRGHSEGMSQGVSTSEVKVTGKVGEDGVSGSASTTIPSFGFGSGNSFAEATKKCDSNKDASAMFNSLGLSQTSVVSVGALPFNNTIVWIQDTLKRPYPVQMTLSSIADLIRPENINHIPLDPNSPDGEMLSAEEIKNFYQNATEYENYCQTMLGKSCSPFISSVKVFGQDASDGKFFSSLQDALNKNPTDPSANLFSILDTLENYRLFDGRLKFKLCYPDLKWGKNGKQCNEWYQTSNPVTEYTITGFQAINLAFEYDGLLGEWKGLGKCIRDALICDNSQFYSAVGLSSPWLEGSIPGPKNPVNDHLSMVYRVELYVSNQTNPTGWTTWGSWGSCNHGKQKRIRFCNDPSTVDNASPCPGNSVETRNECPDCQDGWNYFPHTKKCYKLFHYSTIITWMDAQRTCRQFGGNLPTIRDDETNLYVSMLAGGAHNWIGAHRNYPDNYVHYFSWINGLPPVYAPFSSGNPSNSFGNEFCVQMMTFETYNASWNDYDCLSKNSASIKIMDFVCQSDLHSIFKLIGGACPDGWYYFYKSNRCYNTFTFTQTQTQIGISSWMDAQQNCTLYGGDLATIYDEATDAFINNLLSTSTGLVSSNAWIGIIRVGPLVDPKPRNDQWIWIDGSPLEYSNWAYNQPDFDDKREFCGTMTAGGLWNDVPCYSQDIPNYVCQL